jgi:hypothetical protein
MNNANRKPIDPKPRKERPIPRRLVQVISALLDGSCKNQRAACERFKISESYVSRSLKSARIQAFIARRTRETIAASQLPATATVLRLLENGKSEHVQLQASEFMLGLNGFHAAPASPGVSVGVNVSVGYVVKLKHIQDADQIEPPEMIDVLPPGEAA